MAAADNDIEDKWTCGESLSSNLSPKCNLSRKLNSTSKKPDSHYILIGFFFSLVAKMDQNHGRARFEVPIVMEQLVGLTGVVD